MPADLVKRLDLDKIYPPFVIGALELLAACRKRGADYVATFGYRSYDEQARIYMAYRAGKGGRAAPPGKSAHQFGLAMDFCRDANLKMSGLQPDWREPAFAILGEEAAKLGLHWGAGYGDRPHISWPGYVSAADLAPLRKIYETSKGAEIDRLRLVWQAVK